MTGTEFTAPSRTSSIRQIALALVLAGAACAEDSIGPAPHAVTLHPDSLTIRVGETAQIVSSVAGPDPSELVLTVLDQEIATVRRDDHIVRALAPGRTFIIASVTGRTDLADTTAVRVTPCSEPVSPEG